MRRLSGPGATTLPFGQEAAQLGGNRDPSLVVDAVPVRSTERHRNAHIDLRLLEPSP